MTTHTQTLIHRFWSHVFDKPRSPAIVLKARGGFHADTVNPFAGGNGNLIAIEWQRSGQAVACIMAYLRKSGFKSGDRVAILAWNCPEWVWADMAIQSLGGITVPIYPHSSADQVNFIVQNAKADIVFTSETEQFRKVTAAKAVRFDDIPALIEPRLADRYVTPFVDWFLPYGKFDRERSQIGPASWDAVKAELAEIGTQLKACSQASNAKFMNVDLAQPATIIYTSGSTGQPKGAVLSHGNTASACEALTAHGFSQNAERDLYLSYLPSAHVYERVDGMYMSLWHGIPVAFCKLDEVGDALKLYRPSIVLGVPAVWRKIKAAIEAQLASATGIKRWLVKWAFAVNGRGFKWWLADWLVFSKIRQELGGSLRILLSGGAAIPPEVIEFFAKFGLELLQGYGLTETSGGVATNRPSTTDESFCDPCGRIGSVGHMVPGMELMLGPLPDDNIPGQGEILLRGPLVFQGYWQLPEENAKAFTRDGWFKTGDRGSVDAEGFLTILGRIKRQIKTDGGKILEPDKVEKAFEGDPIVQYVVPVGDNMPFFSGLIFINQQAAKERLGRALPDGVDAAAYLASQPEVIAAVQAAVTAANTKLERWETLKKFQIVPAEASVVNGLLTPTLKIRTEEVNKRFKALIDGLYTTGKKS